MYVSLFLGFTECHVRPLTIYKDSVTTRVKHVAVPISFVHHHIVNGNIKIKKIGTHLNLADSGNKPNYSPAHF